ncbi:DUF3179 domain-containing protein [soil metagenome]
MAINQDDGRPEGQGQNEPDPAESTGQAHSAVQPDGGHFRGVLIALVLVALTFIGGKLYLDWQDKAIAQQQILPGRQPSAPSFDLSQATISPEKIRGGGPPKDGIPALTDPKLVKAGEARYLRPDDRVAGMVIDGEARAYPLRILTWHEIVNDEIQSQPIAMTYCPLCDSVAAFDRRTCDGVKEFGVSGLLYNSNVLMFDRDSQPEALWTQIGSEAVSGPLANQDLKSLPVELTTWADWSERHPETLVLSAQTGHPRDYNANPYAGYFQQPGLMFPVEPTSDRLPEKEKVLGVRAPDGSSKAYPVSAFAKSNGPAEILDEVGGQPITIRYNPKASSLRVVNAGDDVEWMYSFWFAWYAFHPDTEIYSGP